MQRFITQKKLKEYINKKNIKVLYNIPYCPEFNPIENVNSMIRNNVRYNKNVTVDDIKNVLQEFKSKDQCCLIVSLFLFSIFILDTYIRS